MRTEIGKSALMRIGLNIVGRQRKAAHDHPGRHGQHNDDGEPSGTPPHDL